MGLIFTHLLRSLGARQVISIDLLDWRVQWGRRLGATDGVDASREDVVEAVRELTGGEMVDLSVEAVGYPEALQSAVRLPRRKGTVLQFGVTRFTSAEFPVNHFLRNELVMVASVGAECVQYFGTAVGMLTSGQLDLAPLITHCLPWAEAQRAFDLYADHADGALKVVLEL
jgi:threonine dehydrogenase-like Zn-dependent dehydrogenase